MASVSNSVSVSRWADFCGSVSARIPVPGGQDSAGKPDRNSESPNSVFEQYDGRCRRGLRLFRIETEDLELPAPFRRRIAKPFHADAAGQATFYGCLDKVGCQEGE